MMNEILTALIAAIIFVFLVVYIKGSNVNKLLFTEDIDVQYSIDSLLLFVKDAFNKILKTNLYEMNLTKEEFEKRVHNKNQLRKALKNCTYGDINAKNYVKDFIKDILVKSYNINEDNVNNIICFSNPKKLSIQDKFEILLYTYKKKYGYRALEKLILENEFDYPRLTDEGLSYIITAEQIESIFAKEKPLCKFEDKLNVISQRLYQLYKGFGVIDEIRDMRIDGVSGGVSGIPPTFQEEIDITVSLSIVSKLPANFDSIWLFFKGKTIHLSFLSFGSESELIRVCKNIYRYNYPGQLSESNVIKLMK